MIEIEGSLTNVSIDYFPLYCVEKRRVYFINCAIYFAHWQPSLVMDTVSVARFVIFSMLPCSPQQESWWNSSRKKKKETKMSSSEANSLLACFLCEFCSELLASKRMFNGKLITLLGVGREKTMGFGWYLSTKNTSTFSLSSLYLIIYRVCVASVQGCY